MSNYKYTNGISVRDREYDRIINTTRIRDARSVTITTSNIKLNIYCFAIVVSPSMCQIHIINEIPKYYIPINMTPVYDIPAIADYYSQIDQSNDQQIMDYHNFCMKISEQIFHMLNNIGTIGVNTKRAC